MNAPPHRPALWARLLACLVLLLLLLPIRSAAEVDGSVVQASRACLERFFAVLGQEDLAGGLRCVTENEKQRAGFTTYLQELFRSGDAYRFSVERFTLTTADADTARGRARIAYEFSEPGSGMRLRGAAVWDLAFIRELDGWKLWAFRDAEAHFYGRFLGASKPEERAELLREEVDLVGEWLPGRLRAAATEQADAGKLDEAKRLAELALEAAAPLKDDYHLAYGHLTHAYVLRLQRSWNPALAALEKAIEAFERRSDDEGIGKAWRAIGSVYQQSGYFQRAADAYATSVSHFRKAKLDEFVAGTLQDLGTAYQRIARLDDALRVYEEALRMQRELHEREPTVARRTYQAELLGNIAVIYQIQERYAEALREFEEARRVYAELGNTRADSVRLTNLGLIYRALGKIKEAEEAFRGAVTAARSHSDRYNLMIALHNLTGFLVDHGDLDEALECGLESSRIASEIQNRSIDAESLNLVASILVKLKRYPQADAISQDAVEEARRAGNRHQEAVAVMGLGFSQAEQGWHEAALVHFQKARALAEEIEASDLVLRARVMEVSALRELRRWGPAAEACRGAVEVVERVREHSRVRSLQTSYFRQYAVLYAQLAEYLMRMGQPEQALHASELLKGRALTDVIQAGAVRLDRLLTPEQRQKEVDLEERLIRAARSVEEAVLTDERQQRVAERERLRTELERFREQLYLQYPALRTQRAAFRPATLQQIGDRLLRRSPETALLSYVVREHEVLLFVLDAPGGKGRLTPYRTAVSGRRLLDEVDRLRTACASPGAPYEEPARWLFRQLIAPAAPRLAGKKHLVLIPDADLGTLPFAALLDGAGKPLASKYALSYAPSVTALLALSREKRGAEGASLLALGDPAFGPELGPLPATRAEVGRLGQLFGKSAEVLTDRRATEAETRRRMEQARYLHFATHGVLDTNRPMFSGLALTPDAGHDGMLQAREVAEMELRAEMVVLSACETALGQRVRGEGVMGLTWAFFAGGASATLASHWQVSDESTSRLMVAFYGNLVKGPRPMTRPEALRTAQLELMRSRGQEHPYYWAAFALSGAWR